MSVPHRFRNTQYKRLPENDFIQAPRISGSRTTNASTDRRDFESVNDRSFPFNKEIYDGCEAESSRGPRVHLKEPSFTFSTF